MQVENIFINGISSDIGFSYASRASFRGARVFGTFRKSTSELNKLALNGGELFYSDLKNTEKNNNNIQKIVKILDARFDLALIATGTMEPLGRFSCTDFTEWKNSFDINLFGPLDSVHALLNSKHGRPKTIIFLAGGGVNSAPVNVSAYITAKIALTKATELLAAEYQDVNFTIIGPGWVKTKIHEEILASKVLTVEEKSETKRRILENDFVPMESILDCIDWVQNSQVSLTSGRNFSVLYDEWGSESLSERVISDPNLFKIRRNEN